MKILVTGATGNQGREVVKYASVAGHEVYALVRDLNSTRALDVQKLGARLVYGDVDNPETLTKPFFGMDAVFSMQNFWLKGHVGEFFQARNIVEAAKAAGISHFIHSSAGLDLGAGAPNIEVKGIIEAIVTEAFPQALIVRPIWFIESLNLSSFNFETGNLEFVTAPDQPHLWVSIADVGRIVASALDNFDPYAGRNFNLASGITTGNKMAEAFSKVFGRKIGYHQFSESEQYQKIRTWAQLPSFVHELDAIFKFIRNTNFTVDWNLHESLLPKRYTLDQWSKEYAFPRWQEGIATPD